MTLLIIDMLNDFFDQHDALARQRGRLVESINFLTTAFRQHSKTILWIRQEFAPDLHDAFLVMQKRNLHVTIRGTKGCEILSELNRLDSEEIIVKKRYSAFFRTNLDTILDNTGSKVLVIAGINTHACVRTTVIDAYQRDYEILLATECIASYDESHHEITKRYLDGGISQLLSNRDIIKILETKS